MLNIYLQNEDVMLRNIENLDVNNALQTVSKRVYIVAIYLLKLYDKLIIILLTNDLTNICSEISKI